MPGIGNGFAVTAPADATTHQLLVHVGGYLSGGRLTAHLSDGSAPDYTDLAATATDTVNNYDRNYTLTYQAASPGQTLTITWVMTSGTHNVSLSAVALSAGPGPASASVTATAGTPQSTVVDTAFATALQATVVDANGMPVPDVTVTFTAPGGGATASFGGLPSVTASTDGSGVAPAPPLTANGVTGSYGVTASVAGIATPATFTLTNLAAGGGGGGALAGSVTTSGAAVNLSAEGPTDWVHWGEATLTRKAGGAAPLSTYTPIGAGAVLSYGDDPRPISWTGGTPTATGTDSPRGVYVPGIGNGFAVTAPADATTHQLLVHVGGYLSGGRLTAHLSDGSAPDYTDLAATATDTVNNYDRNYTLTYQAASPGQTLTITWVMTSGTHNVSLSAVALSAGPGPASASVTATAGTPQSTVVDTAFATALQATVVDANGMPVPDVTVTFTAPGGGATASFGGLPSVTASTDGSGVAPAPPLTANGVTGSYGVTASVAGIATPATFTLTNLAAGGGGGGALAGSVTTSGAAVNLSAEGPTDWVHWGEATLTRKAGGAAPLSTYTPIGAGAVLSYGDDPRPISWTGGTPTATGTDSPRGVYVPGIGNGFAVTAPADATTHQLLVHVGGYLSGGRLTAHLSDGSAPDYTDLAATATDTVNNYDRNYTLTYQAASPGQTLTITWVMTSGTHNVSLSAVALSNGP